MNNAPRTMWTLKHENEFLSQIPSTVNLKLAMESGYLWVNKNDGFGWKQIAALLSGRAR